MRKELKRRRRHHHNTKISPTTLLTKEHLHQREMLFDVADEGAVDELGLGMREMELEGNYFGRYSCSIVLYGASLTSLQSAAAECIKVFAIHGATVHEETYNQLNAWLAVLPGNYHYNLRYVYLSNENYGDLSFLWTIHTGELRNPHLGGAEYLAVLETNHATPYFHNLHCGDNGHTLIFGAPGSGKSFFVNFLLTFLRKYQPLIFIFDVGGSYEHLTRLFGGSYFRIRGDQPAFAVNPFSLPDSPAHRQFLFAFVKVLIESGGYPLGGRDAQELFDQLGTIYALDPACRRLSTLATILPHHIAEHLQPWVQGGQFGSLFDNQQDTLELARFQCFDFEAMEQYPTLIEPLLFYVLHRASHAIQYAESREVLKTFVIDEAWRFLRHATTRSYILSAVKTWRKHNGAMILATQSSGDLRHSEFMDILIETCQTQFFLSNPGIDRQTYQELFHLNHTEADLIMRLAPKRQLLLKRPNDARVLNLNVDAKSRWIYETDPLAVERRRRAIEQFGFEQGIERLAQGWTH